MKIIQKRLYIENGIGYDEDGIKYWPNPDGNVSDGDKMWSKLEDQS